MSSLDYLDLCRLCLVKDRVSVPIFGGEGNDLFLKIAACLPVKVGREDKLPKKICDDCVYKVELFYEFWNTTANAEKRLLQWLGEVNVESGKQGYVPNVLNPNVMKQEQSTENRLDGSVMQQVGEHQNNMGMSMMDNMGLGIPMMIRNTNQQQQQITSVPMDTSGSPAQNVQAVPGPSSQTTHNQISQNQTSSTQQEDEEESSEDDENSDDECDGDEGLPVKEESEEDPNSRTIEPTTFVNVSLACDEAGPSGLQQQKITDMPEMPISQSADGDPKTGSSLDPFGDVRNMYEFGQWNIQNVYTLVDCARTDGRRSSEKLITNSGNDFPSPNSKEKTATTRPEAIPSNQAQEPYNGKGCRPLYCDRCGKVFYQKYNLRNHMMSYRYPCSICTEVFRTKLEIMLHVTERHGLPVTAPVERYQYSCTDCDFKTRNKTILTEHILRQHTDKYAYVCEICPREFKVKSDLTEHMKQDHLITKCFICSIVFKHHKALVNHVKSKHGEQPYQCKRCKRTLESQESLDRHTQWHTDMKKRASIPCPKCGKLIRDCNLSRHMLKHSGKKPSTCSVCGKSFRRQSDLQLHLLAHAGKKLYVCDICGQKLARKSGLRDHRKRLHPGPKPPLPPVSIKDIVKDVIETYEHVKQESIDIV